MTCGFSGSCGRGGARGQHFRQHSNHRTVDDVDQVPFEDASAPRAPMVVRSVTVWQRSDGAVRLASAGDDGAVLLWDPERGTRLRMIEVGPTQLWGLSDAPVENDVLGREVLVDAVADQLCPPLSARAP